MWRSNEPVVEDISDLPGNDIQSKRRRSRRHAWRDGLADQTVVQVLEDVRSYRAFERLLIRSIDPRTAIELALVHRLANLLWRLRRASAIETGLFEAQGEFLLAQRQSSGRGQPGAVQTAARLNGHGKNAWLERTTRAAGQRPRIAINVHTSTARTKLEVPSHRPTIPAPFRS